MIKRRGRVAALAAIELLALTAAAGCATGTPYSISSTAPSVSGDQASSDEGFAEEDGRGRRWRRFFFRRGDGGLLLEASDTGGGEAQRLGTAGPGDGAGGLRYLAGNLLPQTGLGGTLAGTVAGLTSNVAALSTNAMGALAGMPGGNIAQTLVNGGQTTTGLLVATVSNQSAGLGGATAGSTGNGVSVGGGGAGVSVGIGTGSGSTPGSAVTGVGASVGVATPRVLPGSLGGVTGGGLAVGVGLGGGGGIIPGVNTTVTNSGPGLLGR